MITCPNCQAQNTDQANFCRECGSTLTPVDQQPTIPIQPSAMAVTVQTPTGDESLQSIPTEPPRPETDSQPEETENIPLPRPDYVHLPKAEEELESAAPEPPPDPEVTPAVAPSSPLLKDRNRNTALILEVVFGIFGMLGVGWIYAGQTGRGAGILVTCLVIEFALCAGVVLSSGIGFVCFVPILMIAVAVSVYYLNRYTQQHPELFKG